MKISFRTVNYTPKKSDGFTLLLVIISGLILAIGAVVISARSFNSLLRTSKQSEGDQAIEIAETGASILLNKLNNNFPYLLTSNCQVSNNALTQQFEEPSCTGWDNFKFGEPGGPDSACSGRSTETDEIMGQLYASVASGKGKYRLRNYEFLGDQIQGGTAIIQVQGQRIKTRGGESMISASAIIEKEVTITPKYCGLPPFVEMDKSDEFGLLANLITLKKSADSGQNSNVIDQESNTEPSQANVHCNDCKYEPEENKSIPWEGVQFSNSKIDGDRSKIPHQALPSPPEISLTDKKILNLPMLDVNPPIFYGSVTINHTKIINTWNNIIVTELSLSDYCHTEDGVYPPVMHCRTGKFEISGMQLTIDPGDGDIRFYFEGDKISISTDNVDIKGDKFGQVAFFGSGNDDNCASGKPDLFDMSGRQTLGPLFIHMPCTPIKLNGDGKIIGSVISKQWSSKGFDLVIPSDASQIMKEKFGISFEKDQDHEFAALGTNRWTLIQMERTRNE